MRYPDWVKTLSHQLRNTTDDPWGFNEWGSTAATPFVATDSVADPNCFRKDPETHPVGSAVNHRGSLLCAYVIFNYPILHSSLVLAIQHPRMSCIQSVKNRGTGLRDVGAQ